MSSAIDWLALTRGRETDRIVAQQLGYDVRGPVGAHKVLLLVNAGAMTGYMLPRYSTDVNKAMRLPLTSHWYWSMTFEKYKGKEGASVACVPRDSRGIYPAYAGEWDDFALNICRAWLEWKEVYADDET